MFVNRHSGARAISALIGLLFTLLPVACADNNAASDHGRRPVFYGGVSSGGAFP